MEPITILTYIAVSHYSCYIITNIYDYISFQRSFNSLHNEINDLRCEIENLKSE